MALAGHTLSRLSAYHLLTPHSAAQNQRAPSSARRTTWCVPMSAAPSTRRASTCPRLAAPHRPQSWKMPATPLQRPPARCRQRHPKPSTLGLGLPCSRPQSGHFSLGTAAAAKLPMRTWVDKLLLPSHIASRAVRAMMFVPSSFVWASGAVLFLASLLVVLLDLTLVVVCTPPRMKRPAQAMCLTQYYLLQSSLCAARAVRSCPRQLPWSSGVRFIAVRASNAWFSDPCL